MLPDLTLSLIAPHAMGDVAGVRAGDWPSFVDGLRAPLPATIAKADLPLVSPATFTGGERCAAAVERVFALGLDIDEAPIPSRAELAAALAAHQAVVYSTSSATAAAPRWRAFVALSRPVTGDEYRRIWPAFVASLPFPVGQAAKDPARAWYLPRAGVDGFFELLTTDGAPLDVEALLAAPAPAASAVEAKAGGPAPAADRRTLAAHVLGRAWPEKGRHGAQLALAGALRRDGWNREAALEFLCTVCREAGDEDRPKREATIAATWASTAPLTGWTRLETHVDPAVVSAARDLVNPDRAAHADLLRELAAKASPPKTEIPPETSRGRSFPTVSAGELAKPLPPVSYIFRHFGIAPGRPSLLAGYGGVGKTFVAQCLALHIAAGLGECWGLPIARGPVAHIDYEMTPAPVQRRYQRQAAGHGIDLAGCDLVLSSMPPVYLSDDDAEAALVELVAGKVLCIVDNLAAAIATSDAKENEASVRKYLDRLTRVSERTGCAFLVLVHERKAGKDEPGGLQRVRGSSAITDASGAVLSVSAGEGDGVLSLAQTKASVRKTGDELLLQLEDVGDVDPDGESTGLAVSRVEARPISEGDKLLEIEILALLGRAPQPTKKTIEACLRVRKGGGVGRVVDALIVRREIAKIPGLGYVVDNAEARQGRIVAAVRDDPRLRSPADIGRAAHVDTDVVLDALRRGVIVRSADGRYLVVDR